MGTKAPMFPLGQLFKTIPAQIFPSRLPTELFIFMISTPFKIPSTPYAMVLLVGPTLTRKTPELSSAETKST
ncbi:hypothetical protein OIU77_010382 [Salix suchowensis]|uniref:Uncharacterized protein n=1 Tax=Salix suchowensis TaxID=1278906 RepID=A0ABQ9AAE8_9ROSI|nr:hypothetical protein OIU77_010382 [Salix suchowensis]